MNWLTVELVEGLQQAIRQGMPVHDHINNIQHATLAGLLEYGCLRYTAASDSLPPLPAVVQISPLGRALSEIRSPLGLRSSGSQKPHIRSVDTREVEFHALEGENPTLEPAWEDYMVRFVRSAVAAGFRQVIADGICATLHEMAENVQIHAASPVGAVAGYHVTPGVSAFTIVDVGVGVLASLRTCREYAHLSHHGDALQAVLRDHASKFGRGKGGNGFRQLFKSLADQRGELRFRTGQARVTMSGELTNALGTESFGEPIPGFQITVVCQTADATTNRPLM
ncbi:MAG: hypothetical protein J0I06_12300 [Planctomycetes bacterium]|nr:hypothetical protein [Planctomycetota bacterium]